MNKICGFDEKELMIKVHTGSAQEIYHTKLADSDVHIISNSSAYASDAIISKKDYELGQKVFKKVISLQDKDPESETYGLWPWYMEETLAEMDVPDYNMADFNAKEMIVSIFEEGENLDKDIKNEMLQSIECACVCIMKRNMGVQYTNVCLTDCFVTVSAGELCNNKKLIEYGRKKLKKFVYYTKGHGDISEYNSPTYSILAINDIGDLLKYINDEETLKYANEANDLLWKMLAEHFDYNTLQLNGPQDRAYSDFVGAEFLKTIAKGAGVDFTKHPKFDKYLSEEQKNAYLKSTRRSPQCPKEYIPIFKGEREYKYIRRMTSNGFNYPFFDFAKATVTYKGDGYAVGTQNRSEMWNQRRPILGYIYNDEKDISFRVKCYHDGFDFASGGFHSTQHKSNILASINFSENRGDTHVDIDKISDGLVSAEDLRITFEFTGDTQKIKYRKYGRMLILDINGVKMRINPFICEFGETEIKDSIDITDNTFKYSLILYSGERKTLKLCEPERAVIAFTVECEANIEYTHPEYEYDGDFVKINWKPDDTELGLFSPAKTMKFIRNMSEDIQFINGRNIFEELFNE